MEQCGASGNRMTTISKTQRWLDLIAYLVGRRFPVAVDELMEKVPAYAVKWVEGSDTDRASVRRTFERDKDELRDLGIPIETAAWRDPWGEEHHGYSLARRDFYLPYLKLLERSAGEGERAAPPGQEGGDRPARGRNGPRAPPGDPARPGEVELSPDDAGTALDALRRAASLPSFPLAREARSGFRKLAFDLEPERFDRTPVLFVPAPSEEDESGELRLLNEALLARKRVAFTYHGIYRDRTTERDVAPYALLFHHGHWYLVGHDALRDDVRIFRLSRMQDVRPNRSAPRTPDFQIPGDFQLSDFVARDAWELGEPDEEPLQARVLFRFPRSLWAERNGKGEPVEERADGAAVRSFQVRQVDPFLRWVLSLEGDAEVLGPPELRRALRDLAERVLALYAAGSEGSPGRRPKPADQGDPGGA